MPRKKILQLVHSLTTGGAEILAERVGRRLNETYEVSFACLDETGQIGERLRSNGFLVAHLNRRSGIDLRCARRLANLVRSEQIDVIHAHQYTPFSYAMISRLLGAGRPTVFTEHGRFLPDYPRRKRILFNRLMLRRRDRLVAVGKSVKRALVENEGLPEGRIDVIYNGIPVEDYARDRFPDSQKWLRQQLEIPNDAIVVSHIARLDYLKDHCTAVRAMQKVRFANVHLAIVGEGPERSKIEATIAELNLSQKVHMMGLREDVPRILAGSDILLLTSISEGIPLTLIEGMAAGLPVVSTDVGGTGEIITHGKQGFLCPAKDPAAVAEAIGKLVADVRLRCKMAAAGVRSARVRFSGEEMYRRYDDSIASMRNGQP